MVYLSYALMFIAGIAGAIYLVLTDHPDFAFIVLIMVGCIELQTTTKTKSKE